MDVKDSMAEGSKCSSYLKSSKILLKVPENFKLFSYFSFERFLCLDLWGQFLFVVIAADAVVSNLAS